MQHTPKLSTGLRIWDRCAGILGTLRDGLAEICYPLVCESCVGAAEIGRLCYRCRQELCQTASQNVCRRCAGTVGPFAGTSKGCDLCQRDKFAFEQVFRLGSYQGTLRETCLRIKRLSGHRLTHVLADLLFEHRHCELMEINPDLVVSVPLHWRRRWQRGYDQAESLAHRLAAHMDKPLAPRTLVRLRHTKPQSRITPTERRKNVRGAFATRSGAKLEGATVLLVDDILTSGSTCHEASRALRTGGAARVFVAIVARGGNISR